jgi:hypothetical protein
MTQLITVKEAVDNAIVKVKEIEKRWVQDTFNRYRECGQVILAAGYERTWNNELKVYFLKETKYSDRTFRRMVELGKQTKEEFGHTVSTYKSLHSMEQGTKKQLPEDIGLLLREEILSFETIKPYEDIMTSLIELRDSSPTHVKEEINKALRAVTLIVTIWRHKEVI